MKGFPSAEVSRLDLDPFGGRTRHDAGPQAQVGMKISRAGRPSGCSAPRADRD